jgi:hypothetical protein
MYILGTSAVKYLVDNEALPQTIRDALAGKVSAYVGTLADMTDDEAHGYPAAYASNFSVFFELPSKPVTDPDDHDSPHIIAAPNVLTTAKLWLPNNYAWIDSTQALDYALITTVLLTASAFTNAVYLVQRGDTAGSESAVQAPGAQYFDKEKNELLVYSDVDKKYISVTAAPIGTMITWGGFMPPPDGWLKCDGSQVSKVQDARLYAVIGNNYNYGTVQAGMFMLPTQDNTIIRYI